MKTQPSFATTPDSKKTIWRSKIDVFKLQQIVKMLFSVAPPAKVLQDHSLRP
jgi:hypothetical protein